MKRFLLPLLMLVATSTASVADITGPAKIETGASATYTESSPTASEYRWSITPEAPMSGDGGSVTLKLDKSGSFTLSCEGTESRGWLRKRLVWWTDSVSITVSDPPKPLGKWSVGYPSTTQTIKAATANDAIAASIPPAPNVKAVDVQAVQATPRGPPKQFARGLKPTPSGVLKAAVKAGEPLLAKLRALPQPPENYDGSGGVRDFGMYGNDRYGTCVTAEEAAAKSVISAKTGAQEIRIPDANVIDYCRKYGGLNGEYLDAVLDKMTRYGLIDDKGVEHKDDPTAVAIDGTKRLIVQLAIYYTGQIKVGIVADDVMSACDGTYGWVLLGARHGGQADHCVGYCGYGSLEFCCKTLGVTVPKNADPKRFCLIMFTWASLGIVDWESAQTITSEWWMRGTDPDRLDADAWRVTYQKAMSDITGGNVVPTDAKVWTVVYPAQDAVVVMAKDAADAAKKVPYTKKATASEVKPQKGTQKPARDANVVYLINAA